MSYSLNSLKGGYIGDGVGNIIADIKGDTRSLNYSSHRFAFCALFYHLEYVEGRLREMIRLKSESGVASRRAVWFRSMESGLAFGILKYFP